MKSYYEAAPKPPDPLPDEPPPTEAQLAAHADAMAQYQADKAAYEAENGPAPEPAPVSIPSAPGGGAGKPAARMGDLTAHGGTITIGVTNVLVGNKPAAVVSNMHTCPMVTGVVPHVGGPINPPGSTTVTIGGLAAARVGDQCTCTGPPDTIAMGEFTTLIG
jgi:uncharacterized Zn-binding protein involved in type VI secretion